MKNQITSILYKGISVNAIEDFWNNQHKGPIKDAHWVSGTPLEEICLNLNLSIADLVGKTVLEIGVGHGVCTKKLNSISKNYAVDITEDVLKKVEGLIIKGYSADKLHLLPENFFDYAISHLVAQHMSTADLAYQIKMVLKSMKPDGIFAMQLADTIDGANYLEENIENITTGGICKPLSVINKMVIDGGGYLSWISPIINCNNKFSKWYFIHIKRLIKP